jgi:chemotaxis protein methyltransferase CheR
MAVFRKVRDSNEGSGGVPRNPWKTGPLAASPGGLKTRRAIPMADPLAIQSVEDLELELLLEGIQRRYGCDLRNYDRRFVWERVRNRLREERLGSVSQLLERVLRRPGSFEALVRSGEKGGEGVFHPAIVWRAVRRKVLPLLRTYSSVRGWVIGGASDADLYSLLFLLEEELSRSYSLYATHLYPRSRPTRGVEFRRSELRDLSRTYASAGGRRRVTDFLTRSNGKALVLPALRSRIVFASHNLATDASFNEFHVIIARNILNRFNLEMRGRSLRLFHESLIRFGFLLLGSGESLDGLPHSRGYRELDRRTGLYQKVANEPL